MRANDEGSAVEKDKDRQSLVHGDSGWAVNIDGQAGFRLLEHAPEILEARCHERLRHILGPLKALRPADSLEPLPADGLCRVLDAHPRIHRLAQPLLSRKRRNELCPLKRSISR